MDAVVWNSVDSYSIQYFFLWYSDVCQPNRDQKGHTFLFNSMDTFSVYIGIFPGIHAKHNLFSPVLISAPVGIGRDNYIRG